MDIEEFERHNTRKCSVLKAGPGTALASPTDSHFALVPVARPGEAWPMHRGRPLTFVCQLNLTHAPHVPEPLRDVKLVTFWFDDEELDTGPTNGAGWCLRAYPSLEGLVPLNPPDDYVCALDGRTAQWHADDDHPTADDPDISGLDKADDEEFELHNAVGTKLGGYPSIMTGPPTFPGGARYVMQIDTEDAVGFSVADSGCVFIGRAPAPAALDRWYLQWQCF